MFRKDSRQILGNSALWTIPGKEATEEARFFQRGSDDTHEILSAGPETLKTVPADAQLIEAVPIIQQAVLNQGTHFSRRDTAPRRRIA